MKLFSKKSELLFMGFLLFALYLEYERSSSYMSLVASHPIHREFRFFALGYGDRVPAP